MMSWLERAEYRRGMSWVIVAAVLAASAWLGYRVSMNFLLYIGAALFVVAILRYPPLGLVALMVAALVVPFEIGATAYTAVNIAILLIPLLLAGWLVQMIRNGAVRLTPSPINKPALLLMLTATLSWLAGNLPWSYFAERANLAAQLSGLAVFVFSAGVMLMVGNQIQDVRWLKRMLMVFFAIGAVETVAMMSAATGRPVVSVLAVGAGGSLFWTWLAAMAGGQAMFNREMPRVARLALLGFAVMVAGMGWFLLRNWAGGWLPPLVALVVLAVTWSWRLSLPALAGAGVLLVLTTPDLLESVVAVNEYSIETRGEAWRIVLLEITRLNPLLGLGPANYYHYTPLFPIRGFMVKFNSHNQYVDIVAQIGIVGLAVFVWLMAALGRACWNWRNRVTDGFARGYLYGCLAGLAGSLAAGMLADWFLPFVYNIGLSGFRSSIIGWILLGGVIALQGMARRTEKA